MAIGRPSSFSKTSTGILAVLSVISFRGGRTLASEWVGVDRVSDRSATAGARPFIASFAALPACVLKALCGVRSSVGVDPSSRTGWLGRGRM